jgi:Fe-S cluster assembly protein SufD
VTMLELPSTRQEAWRWSDLSALPALAEAPHRPPHSVDDLWLGCGGPRLLFVDGVYDAGRSQPGPIAIGRLELEGSQHPLGKLAGADGWSLRLGGEHAPAGTVEIIHLATGGAGHVAGEIRLDEDAQASVVQSFVGDGWANHATRVALARSARLMLTRRIAQDGGFTSLTDDAALGAGASLTTVLLAEGVGDSRVDLAATVAGEGGYVEAGGALLARASQRHDVNIVLRHADLEGQSRQVWRAVAEEGGTDSIAARVEVARGAQKTDADQSLRGLLLDRTSTINLKPELEIFADDVRCAHGATVGELDARALFYLASRGVPPVTARALLTRAFVGDALDRIGEEAVREAFGSYAEAWLGGGA